MNLKKYLWIAFAFILGLSVVSCSDDITIVTTDGLSVLEETADGLLLNSMTSVSNDFLLPAESGDIGILWTSNNTEVISVSEGAKDVSGVLYFQATVTSPTNGVNATVTLTGVFSLNGETYSKDFVITVVSVTLSDAEQLAIYVGQIESSYTIEDSFVLPEITNGTYTSVSIPTELQSYLSYSGGVFTVTQPSVSDATGTIYITIAVGEASQTVSTVLVIKQVVIATGTDLFISEYIEGSSYEKYIELYNPTANSIDLSTYTLELYSNGATTASTVSTLSGTIEAGGVIILANSGAVGYTGSVVVTSAVNFSGNDVVVLKHNGDIIDSIGQIGNSDDFAKDVTLVRNPSITSGDTDPSDTFSYSTEWTSYEINDVSHLGSHTID